MTDHSAAVLLLSVALALAPATIYAGTYHWVDEQGTVTYSDRPPQPEQTRAPAPEASPAPEVKAPDAKPDTSPAPEVKAPDTKPAPEAKAPDVRPALGAKSRDVKAFAPPAAIAKTGPTKVDELLELSGARTQLVGLLSGIAGQLRPARGQMSAKDQAAVDRILRQALRHEAVYTLVRDAFLLQVDRTNLEATAAWLRSPLARKIVALEIASSEPGTEQKVAAYAAAIKANPPPEHRVELLQRLDWATAASEISADLAAAVSRGITTAVSAAGPAEQRLRPGQIEDRVAQVRAQASEVLREPHGAATLYTYRELEDDELTAYVLFSGSEAGRWYNTAMRKAMVNALGKAVEQTAAELVRAVPLDRWARAATPAPQQVK